MTRIKYGMLIQCNEVYVEDLLSPKVTRWASKSPVFQEMRIREEKGEGQEEGK